MVSYILTRFFIEMFRFMPFWLLYIHSDLLAFLMFKVFGYRKKIIFDNLQKAFPEKNEKEIKSIANKFYKNFTDILLESLKGQTMSDKSAKKRFIVLNPEIAEPYYQQNRSILGLGAHYANWEWAVSGAGTVKHKSVCVYKAVKNKRLNDFMRKNRERWGMKLFSMENTRVMFKDMNKKPVFAILIADQNPSTSHNAIWVDFLGRDTPCIHGPEAYSKIYNLPLVYFDFQRVKRGHYQVTLTLLHDDPKSLPKGEVTKLYMNKLEDVIRKKPEDWMWTHKRWKHKRVDGKLINNYYYK